MSDDIYAPDNNWPGIVEDAAAELDTDTDCADCGVDLVEHGAMSISSDTEEHDDGTLEVTDTHLLCPQCSDPPEVTQYD